MTPGPHARRWTGCYRDGWQGLCEHHGFVLAERIEASLVEEHGTQEHLFEEAPTVVETRRESFFRRLARAKGSPEIRAEVVLIMTKARE